jgi:hypothetical protein
MADGVDFDNIVNGRQLAGREAQTFPDRAIFSDDRTPQRQRRETSPRRLTCPVLVK